MKKLLILCTVLAGTLLLGYNTANPFMREEVVVSGGYAAGGAEIDNTGTGKFQEVVADTLSGAAIGSALQAWDEDLDDIASFNPRLDYFLVGTGTDWHTESPTAVAASLGLTIGTRVQAYDNDLDDLAGLTHANNSFIVSDGTDWKQESANDALLSMGWTAGDPAKLTGIAAGAEVNVNADWTAVAGDALILNKPTLGTVSAQDYNSIGITGGQINNTTIGNVIPLTGVFTSLEADSIHVADYLHFWDTSNTSLGYKAGYSLEPGMAYNTFIGRYAGYGNSPTNAADYNVAVGDSALYNLASGASNVAVGPSALRGLGGGSDNIAVGNSALAMMGTGSNNIGLGTRALNTSNGSGSIAVGNYAGYWAFGNNNFYVGNVQQASEAGDQAYSLLYGKFSGAAGSLTGQSLKVNGAFSATSLSGPLTGDVTGNAATATLAANSSQLLGATWAAPGAIGATTPAAIAGTTGTFTSNRVADSSASTERLTNGDNEAAIAVLTGGTGIGVRCTAAQSSTVARGGTKSLKVTPSGAASSTYYYQLDQSATDAPGRWTLGARYVFSAYVYVPSGSAVTAARVVFYWNGIGVNGNIVTIVPDTWMLVTVDAVAPMTQTNTSWYPYLLLTADSSVVGNVCYWDNLSLLEYSGGQAYVGGNAIVHGKLTGGGNNLGLDVDRSGNAVLDGDLTVTGGDITAGANGATRAAYVAEQGAGGYTPGYYRADAMGGTGQGFIYANDDGTIASSTSVPDGSDLTFNAFQLDASTIVASGSVTSTILRSSKTGTSYAGIHVFEQLNGNLKYLWADNNGSLRVKAGSPPTAGDPTDGLIVAGYPVARMNSVTATANDTTPSVGLANLIVIPGTWSAGNNITTFDGGFAGQRITIIGGDSDCVVVDNAAANMFLAGNWTATAAATLELVSTNGTAWYEVSRSAN